MSPSPPPAPERPECCQLHLQVPDKRCRRAHLPWSRHVELRYLVEPETRRSTIRACSCACWPAATFLPTTASSMNSCRLSRSGVITQTNVSGWAFARATPRAAAHFRYFGESTRPSRLERRAVFQHVDTNATVAIVSMIRYARLAIKWTDLASPVEGENSGKITSIVAIIAACLSLVRSRR